MASGWTANVHNVCTAVCTLFVTTDRAEREAADQWLRQLRKAGDTMCVRPSDWCTSASINGCPRALIAQSCTDNSVAVRIPAMLRASLIVLPACFFRRIAGCPSIDQFCSNRPRHAKCGKRIPGLLPLCGHLPHRCEALLYSSWCILL